MIAFTAMSIFVGAGNGTIYSVHPRHHRDPLRRLLRRRVRARKHASAGSLYTYVAKGLGPTGAYLAGVTLVIG
ncbi:hypothetical protein ACRAWC_23825 [Leifsonia sp. L25]|uniref:hypothetical protein n=1 Tax=Leifsonia sp. L25 TaxID=3423957 RepID=UPI003D680A06